MRALVTRAEGENDTLRDALVRGGAEVVAVPLIAFQATGCAIPAPRPGDVVALTSATAARALAAVGRDDLLRVGTLAVVGPRTEAEVRALGVIPALTPRRALADALADALGDLTGRRVLYPRAEVVPPRFEQRLRAAGAEVVPIPLYRTVCPPGAGALLDAALPVDVITLASGSAARHLVALGRDLGHARIVAIGPSTAREARALGLTVAAVADPHTAEGLAAAALSASSPG
ncbi:MAG: uroporphyrinogen-III synthase [Alphaproteobacteria bacterium]|nr:uroporphyrinogen-III synthase [Alphaproteobacteria bacterium]